MNKMYGYIRVSTREQNDDRQRIALENFGVSAKNFFVDKQSGKDFARPQYRKLMRKIKAGDTLVVKSIDRLGRNYAGQSSLSICRFSTPVATMTLSERWSLT